VPTQPNHEMLRKDDEYPGHTSKSWFDSNHRGDRLGDCLAVGGSAAVAGFLTD
jgi:hypothetical protein